eukprot:477115_1
MSVLSNYECYKNYCIKESEINWYFLENLDNNGLLKENTCWNNWNKNKQEFIYYLMNECLKIFEIIINLIENGNCLLNECDTNKCLNNYASFCNNILMDYVKASKYYKLCIEKNKNNINALIGRGIAMIGKGFPKGGIESFEKVIKIIGKQRQYEKQRQYVNGLIKKASGLLEKKMENEKTKKETKTKQKMEMDESE